MEHKNGLLLLGKKIVTEVHGKFTSSIISLPIPSELESLTSTSKTSINTLRVA